MLNSEGFPEGLLRLVVLVSLPFIEFMGSLAKHVRPHRHPRAPLFASPILDRIKQFGSDSQIPLALGHDQPVQFGSRPNFDEVIDAYMRPANNSRDGRFRDKKRVPRSRSQPAHPLLDFRGCDRIPKLAAELRNIPTIAGACMANPQPLLFRSFAHPTARFLCRRNCTASLCSSRNASAAIHRADQEPCRRIRSAARIASLLSRGFRFPIFRSDQFTAFLTKFRSSCASRSITARKRMNFASLAVLSL